MIMEIAGAEEWAAHVVSISTPVCYKYCVSLSTEKTKTYSKSMFMSYTKSIL
jgi:hypothetical protein